MVVYFDWKTVIYIYVCGICRTKFMLPMEMSVTFIGACANDIDDIISGTNKLQWEPVETHERVAD
jgi:hypothetical protein